jgi:hypothetical protein
MSQKALDSSVSDQTMLDSFRGILIYDVISAFERAQKDNTQSAKRDLIRTIFVAIEGLVWTYREHVRSVAQSTDELTPIMALAFSETSYFVSETGKLEQQTRFISLTAMLRYATRVAEEISQDLKIDFGCKGWSDLQKAIAIRNRITHPKSKTDLELTSEDIKVAQSSLFWLLGIIHSVMEATNNSAKSYLADMTTFIDKLTDGDEEAWAEYRDAANLLSNEADSKL